jgi:hypothetical protein
MSVRGAPTISPPPCVQCSSSGCVRLFAHHSLCSKEDELKIPTRTKAVLHYLGLRNKLSLVALDLHPSHKRFKENITLHNYGIANACDVSACGPVSWCRIKASQCRREGGNQPVGRFQQRSATVQCVHLPVAHVEKVRCLQ